MHTRWSYTELFPHTKLSITILFFKYLGEPDWGLFYYYMQCECCTCAACILCRLTQHFRIGLGTTLHSCETCGPLVANHPRMSQLRDAPLPQFHILSVDESPSVALPTHWAVPNWPWVGARHKKIPIMPNVGFERTTYRLCARNSDH